MTDRPCANHGRSCREEPDQTLTCEDCGQPVPVEVVRRLRRCRAQTPLRPGPERVICPRCNGLRCVRVDKWRSRVCPRCHGKGEVVLSEEEEREKTWEAVVP